MASLGLLGPAFDSLNGISELMSIDENAVQSKAVNPIGTQANQTASAGPIISESKFVACPP